MLACAGLGDEALLAHSAREQRLAEGVVNLVCAGVGEILALEIDSRATKMFGESFGEIERGRAAGILAQVVGEFVAERLVAFCFLVDSGQLNHGRHERFRNKAAAEDFSEMSLCVRLHCHFRYVQRINSSAP